MTMTPTSLHSAQYLNLATFRKTGVRVETPVWFAEFEGRYYVFSNQFAGKVKRLRNSSQCQIAPCTMLGKLTGSWQDMAAFLISDDVEIRQAHRLLQQKYGWQMRLLDAGAQLGGRINQRSYIRIQAVG